MILTQTKATGYSLGLPLWWPDKPTQLSTGWLQGISLVLRGTPIDVYLTRYKRQGNVVSLTFSTALGILCSLEAELGSGPRSYALQRETPLGSDVEFVSGFVTLYGATQDAELDLSGAMVCPKYITYIDSDITNIPRFTLASEINELVYISADLNTLDVQPSIDVNIKNPAPGVFEFFVSEEVPTTSSIDTVVYTINGSTGSDGVVTITLPEGWVATKTGPSSAKIGNLSELGSCPEYNYLEQRLDPGNFTQDCPINAFYKNGKLSIQDIVCSRYNIEYDTSSVDGERGLHWNEFSKLHDEWESE